MLKKVRIKNFISCKDTEFDLEQITVLIGRNAAGKTNILRGIQGVCDFILERDGYPRFRDQERIVCEYLIDDIYLKYDFQTDWSEYKITENLSCYENNKWNIIAERKEEFAVYYENNIQRDFKISNDVSVISAIKTFFPEKSISFLIKNIIKFCGKVRYYTLESKLEDNDSIVISKEYEAWLSHKNNSVTLRLLDSWKENKELFNELQELLGVNGLNLISSISVFEIKNHDICFYDITFNLKNSRVNYPDLSYGTRRVLMILLALLYDKSTTLLIEQPEDGIHIGLLRKVISICLTYAKAYNKQLIITTHSPDVIDMFQPESIRFVKMTEQGTKVSKLDNDLLAVIPEYLENEGTLSDFIEFMDDE